MKTNTDLPAITQNVTKLSDRELINLCKKYGSNARLWMRKFADLLPEIERRRLYKRRGCCSIHEFAAKYAGMNRNTTDQVLWLCEKLEDKPMLRGLLVEQGWSKLRIIASVATLKTDAFWSEKVRTLTKGALELYVRNLRATFENGEDKKASELFSALTAVTATAQQSMLDVKTFPREGFEPEKCAESAIFEAQNERCSIQFGDAGTGSAEPAERENLTFKLDAETKFRLEKFKQKLEKQRKEPLTYNQLLKAMLDELESDSERVATRSAEKTKTASRQSKGQKADSRHISAQIDRELEEQYHGRCAFPGCNKPATHRHHTKRYALHKEHDSATIVPLCKHHHDLAHAGLIENESDPPRLWKLRSEAPWWDENNIVDKKVQEYKAVAIAVGTMGGSG
ncbi:MAG: HNH endonuclease signature motif containing protein [Candidatus Gracilibacteria bacterium]